MTGDRSLSSLKGQSVTVNCHSKKVYNLNGFIKKVSWKIKFKLILRIPKVPLLALTKTRRTHRFMVQLRDDTPDSLKKPLSLDSIDVLLSN